MHALLGLAFAADALADALELLRHALVGGDDLVERVGDLAFDAEPVARHADREVADPHRLQRRPAVRADGSCFAVHGGLGGHRSPCAPAAFGLTSSCST